MHPLPPVITLAIAAVALALSTTPARAQLREPEVLVLYDSRISDSVLVAEYYAGSAKVPGGIGGQPGAHPRVVVLNLSSLPAVGASGQAGFASIIPDIDEATFKSRVRDPLRNYLAPNPLDLTLARRIRSIVLTKGLPHRISDQASPGLGDNPGQADNAVCGGNITYSSLDAELALLWQNLDTGEAGGKGDSKRDGWIVNPFEWKALPHAAWPRTFISTSPKSYAVPTTPVGCVNNLGVWWLPANPNVPSDPASLTVGDVYMVCRLDGNTVADVRAIIDRAQNIVANTGTAAFILDSDGNTYDGGFALPFLDFGPDYAQTADLLVTDGRFDSNNLVSDFDGGVTGFWVGPRIAFSGSPHVEASPILLLASFGANHSGVTAPMSTTYGASFNYAQGAVFNTIESYNGRAYGGLGQNIFAAQQQSADALAAGCTFAVANVYEPFTLTIPDNYFIVQNFFLGNLSWAEAAYTSLPVLSWAQIVVGDPLARVRRDTEDINTDGRLTIDDLYAWKATPRDLNRDGAADDTDYRLLESSVRGPELVNMKAEQR